MGRMQECSIVIIIVGANGVALAMLIFDRWNIIFAGTYTLYYDSSIIYVAN